MRCCCLLGCREASCWWGLAFDWLSGLCLALLCWLPYRSVPGLRVTACCSFSCVAFMTSVCLFWVWILFHVRLIPQHFLSPRITIPQCVSRFGCGRWAPCHCIATSCISRLIGCQPAMGVSHTHRFCPTLLPSLSLVQEYGERKKVGFLYPIFKEFSMIQFPFLLTYKFHFRKTFGLGRVVRFNTVSFRGLLHIINMHLDMSTPIQSLHRPSTSRPEHT